MAESCPPEFLTSILSRYTTSHPKTRPFVTLTFAQSLDAKIAGKNGKQLILSGEESMQVEIIYRMRTMHDAILVGIGTALNDDPQLNTRHLPPPTSESPQNRHHLPRPIILDTNLRLPPTSKLLTNYQSGKGRRPYILCCASPEDPAWSRRFSALQDAGARVIHVDRRDLGSSKSISQSGYRLPISAVLATLLELKIQSLMVEGGAQVIESFLAESSRENPSGVIDTVIVTVAPTFVGVEGVGYGVPLGMFSGFQHIRTEIKGRDAVVSMIATGDQ